MVHSAACRSERAASVRRLLAVSLGAVGPTCARGGGGGAHGLTRSRQHSTLEQQQGRRRGGTAAAGATSRRRERGGVSKCPWGDLPLALGPMAAPRPASDQSQITAQPFK